MDEKKELKVSKTMSYILRHNPFEFGLVVDYEGYVDLECFIEVLNKKHKDITIEDIDVIVLNDENGRYEFNDSKSKIRAVYGHSFEYKIEKPECIPPRTLYHGTNLEAWNNINLSGYLKRMERQYVFLSDNKDSAKRVSLRRKNKKYVILKIDTELAGQRGIKFYRETNGIYMSDDIPVECICVDEYFN